MKPLPGPLGKYPHECLLHNRRKSGQAYKFAKLYRGPYQIVGLYESRPADQLVDQVTRQSELLSVNFADVQTTLVIPPVQPLIQRAKHQAWRTVKIPGMTLQKLLNKIKHQVVGGTIFAPERS